MKILYVASSSGRGGATVALRNLLAELRGEHSLYVVLPSADGIFCNELQEMKIPYYVLDYGLNIYPRSRNPLKFIYKLTLLLQKRAVAINGLKRIIEEVKPDIVHTNIGPLDIGFEACKELNLPHVWHLREYQDLDFAMTFYPGKVSFMRKIHTVGNYNIAITRGVFDYWRLRPTDRVIYDGVFRSNEESGVYVKHREEYFLFAGRVEEAKGVDLLLRVFVSFCNSDDRYKLLVAGRYDANSSYWNLCNRIIRDAGIEHRVEFLGERDDVYSLMRRAAALVVPSRFEGFGFITAEAMYNGCLVIGRNVAGTAEQFDIGLQECGSEIGFRFVTEDELLDAMIRVVSGEGSRMRMLAKRVVDSKYGSKLHAERVLAYYDYVLKSRRYEFCRQSIK